jgi:hypothetical protein
MVQSSEAGRSRPFVRCPSNAWQQVPAGRGNCGRRARAGGGRGGGGSRCCCCCCCRPSLCALCPGEPLPIHEHTHTHTDSLALHTDLLFLSLIRNLQRPAAASPNEDPQREQTLRPMSNAMPEDLAEIVRGVASLLLALLRPSFAHPAWPMLSVRLRSSRRSQLARESSILIELQAAAGLGLGRSAPKAEAKQGPVEGRSSGSPPSAMPDRLASNSTLAHHCTRPDRASLPAVRRHADRLCLSVHPSLLRSGRSSLLPRRTRRR